MRRTTSRRAPTLLIDDDQGHEREHLDDPAAEHPPIGGGDGLDPDDLDADDPELYTETSEMEVLDDPVAVAPRGGRGVLYGILALLVAGVLAAGGYFGAQTYAQASFYVDVDDGGQVLVYQGRKGGFLWGLFEPVELTPAPGLAEADVDTDLLAEVRAGDFESEDDARAAVAELVPVQASSIQPDDADAGAADQAPSEGNTDSDAGQTETTTILTDPDSNES